MELTINLTENEIIDGLSDYNNRSQLLELITGIDLKIAEVDFTQSIIEKLMESLLVDFAPENQEKAKKLMNDFFELLNQ